MVGLHFRKIRDQYSSKFVKEKSEKLDSPSLPIPPLPTPPASELPPPLVEAMENAQRSRERTRPASQGFFNLLPPSPNSMQPQRLEDAVKSLFSADHFHYILADHSFSQSFSAFVNKYQPQNVPLLIRYMDMQKAAKAIEYANAITRRMTWMDKSASSRLSLLPAATMDTKLRESASQDLQTLCKEVLPAFITHTLVDTVVDCVARDITGTSIPATSELVGSLAEVFCLTDPSRKDNPIIYASEEFYHTTQYGTSYAINRNCRFLQGPETDQHCVSRLSQALKEGRESCETILNYRRDGTPFVNLLMMSPLMDDLGNVKYFIGCQIDVTGLVEQGKGIASFRSLLNRRAEVSDDGPRTRHNLAEETSSLLQPLKVLRELSRMLSRDEMEAIRNNAQEPDPSHRTGRDSNFTPNKESLPSQGGTKQARRIIEAEVSDHDPRLNHTAPQLSMNAIGPVTGPPTLPGVYRHYLLIRPYPSCQIVFLSPSFRVPDILRSNFFEKVGGPEHTINSLKSALRDGASVTAKILWQPGPHSNSEPRPRWIRCSPLTGANGRVGVWMVVVVPVENQISDMFGLPRIKALALEEPSSYRQSRVSMRSSNSRSTEDLERHHDTQGPFRTASLVNMRKVSMDVAVDGRGITARVPITNGMGDVQKHSDSGLYRGMFGEHAKETSPGAAFPMPPNKYSPPRTPDVVENGLRGRGSFHSHSQQL